MTATGDLTVAVHGCELIVEPGVRRCFLNKPGTVSLWVPGVDEYELRRDGVALAARTLHDREGTMRRIELTELEGTLELARGGETIWSLELARTSAQYRALIESALIRANAGELEAAATLLDAGRAELDAYEAALTRCLEAQLAYDSPRLSGILDELRTSPAVGCRGQAHMIAVFTRLYENVDFNAALTNLAQAREDAAFDFRVYLDLSYQQANFDLLVGRIDEALVGFERAIRLATLIDERDVLGSAQVMKAITLARLGRSEEAEQLAAALEAALAEGDDEDAVVIAIRYNLAWTALLRREADPRAARDPTPTLERLAAIYEKQKDARQAARTHLHLALAAIQTSDASRAEASLAQVDGAMLDARELVWLELVGVRVALHVEDLSRADAHLARAQAFAQLTEDRELTWLVWTAKATLARARGQTKQAIAAYEQAARLADVLALAVPGTAGRSLLVTSHGRGVAGHVELLVELSRIDEALCVAAGSRARHLRALWARTRPPLSEADQRAYQALLGRYDARRKSIEEQLEQAWMSSTEQLEQLHLRLRSEGEQADELLDRATALLEREAPRWSCVQILPREPGHALMTMIADAEEGAWTFFLARGGRATQIVQLPAEGSAESRSRTALREFDIDLNGVERLDVIPIGEYVSVDFQRLLFERPALGEIVLRHSLGLGEIGDLPNAGYELRAAVVAGASDLDAVGRETERVGEVLRSQAWQVESSWIPTAAEQPTLLHYSGHGHHSGLAGWRSSIDVPGFGPLTAANLIAAQRAPTLVVLGACSTGNVDEAIIDGGMNLAAAFLLAGAELVIAPSGPVDDETALALASDLYREFASPDSDALIGALIERQRAELKTSTSTISPRSMLRWRAWVP